MAVAAVVALSVTACDPYTKANTAAPTVIGVSLTDTIYNEIAPPNYLGCNAPYPEVDKTWADQAFPGLCNEENAQFGIPSVCPVNCFPPRMGPGYAPLFTGNIGGSYQTTLPGQGATYNYTIPAAWALGALNPVPPLYQNDDAETLFTYGTIRILFNKLLEPGSVQPNPLRCDEHGTGPNAIKVFLDGTDVTETHNVCYIPNSDTEYWGASITVTSPNVIDVASYLGSPTPVFVPILVNNSTYRVTGTVTDQQGNTAPVDVTVRTGDDDIWPRPTATPAVR